MINPLRIVAPPPLLYLGGFVSGYLVHRVLPLPMPPGPFNTAIGVVLLVLGGAIVVWSLMTLRRIGTPVSPYKPALHLATEGPYRHSRNPIYLGVTGLYLASAMLLGWIWPVVLLIPVIGAVHYGVVLREERYLQTIFGARYQAYQSQVRRWL